ncbi:RDD family protein [Puerhibacterium sp. TATVAM-FAB25]|uniref:RDD family protein n=1 Tax=Puerhibacterium sp. TATVAM-FAB25 TaxID=3093699 RepID=UPI00397C9E9C
MSTTVCDVCGSPQAAPGPFCTVCGTPRGDGAARGPEHPVGTTTEPELVAATRRGAPPAQEAHAPLAGVGRRFTVAVLDSLATSVPSWLLLVVGLAAAGRDAAAASAPAGAGDLLAALAGWYLGAGLLSLAIWLALCAWEGRTGAAVGGRLLGVRTVDQGTRRPVGFGRAVLRSLVVGAGSLVLGVGGVLVLLSPLFDGSGRLQGWHDKAARSVVVRTQRTPRRAAPRATADRPSAAAPTDPWAFPTGADAPAAGGIVTGVPGRAPAPAAAPDVAPAAAPAAVPAPGPAAVPSPVPAAVAGETTMAPEPEEDGWDATRLSAPRSGTGAGTRLTAAPVVPVPLELPTGVVHVVAGPTLVGRDPQAASGGWALLALDDPRRSVSKTHAELGVDHGGLWVTDRGSTNGTVVSVPGAPPRVVEPGARVRVPAGASIHLGEYRVTARAATDAARVGDA